MICEKNEGILVSSMSAVMASPGQEIPSAIQMPRTWKCCGCGCPNRNCKYFENGFCKICFPTGYSDVTGDPIKKEMNLKEALYMLFNEQGNLHDCQQRVFDFIRRHVAEYFPSSITEANRKSFNMNIECSSYDNITIENGKLVQSKDEENTQRVIEVFEPHVKGPGEGEPFAKFRVDRHFNISIF